MGSPTATRLLSALLARVTTNPTHATSVRAHHGVRMLLVAWAERVSAGPAAWDLACVCGVQLWEGCTLASARVLLWTCWVSVIGVSAVATSEEATAAGSEIVCPIAVEADLITVKDALLYRWPSRV
jgi:hypothetical protein